MVKRKASKILAATILAGIILAGMPAMTALGLSPKASHDEELIVFCGATFTGAMSEIGKIYE